jgi:hypothetical protein
MFGAPQAGFRIPRKLGCDAGQIRQEDTGYG